MEIRYWGYADVYWNPGEEEKAAKEKKRLEKLGYELQERDSGNGPYEHCDQYLRSKLPFTEK